MSPSTEATLAEIARPALKDVVSQRIVDAILAGELKSGQRITELGLAKSLAVAQATVREAFVSLEHRGFLERRGSRATHVTQLTREDVEDIYAIRNRLEILVIELVTVAAAPDLGEVQKALQEMEVCALAADLHAFYRADLKFHQGLAGATGNRHLCQVLDVLLVKLFAFDTIQHELPRARDLKDVAGEHRRLFELIKRRDGNLAKTFMEEAMQKARTDDMALAGNK